MFNGDGVDIATPIVNALDKAVSGIVRGAEGATNAVINTINNSFDTTRNPSSPDFLWRKNRYNLAHSFADTVRITKFLTTPSGIFFIIKQELLERQNVKVDGYTRLYNPGSTIAQVGVNSIGYHLNKAGLNPFERSYFKGGNTGYFDNARFYKDRAGFPNYIDDIGRGSNRLTLLTLSKINQEQTRFTSLGYISNQYGVNAPDSEDILTYGGGPGSVLGIGNTNIRWQNKTRTVLLRENKTGFSQSDSKDSYNYLTPLGRPVIEWYYNPQATSNIVNGITKKISVYQNVLLSLPEDQKNKLNEYYFGTTNVLRDNNSIISSSLYAPPSTLDKGTIISKLGDDPSKPEYYTPNGNNVKWSYTASTGVTSNYVKALEDADLRNIVNDNYRFLNPESFKIGESSTVNSDTDIFGDKDNNFNNESTLDGTQISNKTSLGQVKNTAFSDNGIQDFRSLTTGYSRTNYKEFNREKTYQDSETTYKGNFYPGFGRVLDPNVPISGDEEDPIYGSDIVDFNFTLKAPDNTPRLIDFKAYIEDWSDGVKAEWNSVKYMGRAESFYKYGGFSREGSVTFLVPTLSRRNLVANYKKLNTLMWSVSPSYSTTSVSGLMRGVITDFTMGDYFRKMPTIIKSVDFSEITDMGWDINRSIEGTVFNRSDSYYTGQLPKGIKVTISFTPLHNFAPRYGQEYIGYYENSSKGIYLPDRRFGLINSDKAPYPTPVANQSSISKPTPINITPNPLPGINTTGLRSTPIDYISNGTGGEFLQNPNFGSGPINTGFNF